MDHICGDSTTLAFEKHISRSLSYPDQRIHGHLTRTCPLWYQNCSTCWPVCLLILLQKGQKSSKKVLEADSWNLKIRKSSYLPWAFCIRIHSRGASWCFTLQQINGAPHAALSLSLDQDQNTKYYIWITVKVIVYFCIGSSGSSQCFAEAIPHRYGRICVASDVDAPKQEAGFGRSSPESTWRMLHVLKTQET